MKQFLFLLIVIGGLAAAGWYAWEPYIQPLLERGGASELAGDDRILDSDGTLKESPAPARTADSSPDSPPEGTADRPASATEPPAQPKSEIDLFVEERYPMPEILPLETIVGNWQSVPERAYPDKVVCSEPLAFDVVVDGRKVGSGSIAPGTPVVPTRLVGDQLTLGHPANPSQTAQAHVDKTDFKQRIRQRYDEFVKHKTEEVANLRTKAKKALEEQPGLLASLQGSGEGASDADDTSDPRFGPVRQSLARGEVPTVKPEEAKTFRWNGTEEIRGAYPGTWDTVTVNCRVETIFGVFPYQVKCLLDGSRVVGWIDPITHDEI